MPEPVVDRLEAVEVEQQQGRAEPVASSRSAVSTKARRLAMPVSESVRAATLCIRSARSFTRPMKVKAEAMENSIAARHSTATQ